jgi:hypothetical protein
MLSYQYNPSDYVFDDTYELHLMDDKIRKHVLTSSKYIFFDEKLKNGYEVRTTVSFTDVLRTSAIITNMIIENTKINLDGLDSNDNPEASNKKLN